MLFRRYQIYCLTHDLLHSNVMQADMPRIAIEYEHTDQYFAFFKHLVFVAAAQLNQKNYNQHKLWSLAIRIFG